VGEESERRKARNEQLARRINEIVESGRPRNGASGEHFICECSKADCATPIDIDVVAYARVREDPRRFIVENGHEDHAVESVVERYANYAVVQKRGEAGRLAEADVV
jgi:hypothetical protein